MSLLLQALRFGGSGMANTAVGLACIFAAKLLGASDVPANLFGYGVGLALSFVLNRRWTFGSRYAVAPQVVRFMLAFALAYAANLATVLALRDLAGLNSFVAQALGILPYTLCFFVLSRYFVFRDAGSPKSRARS
jgi:putative flippase GtrA